MPSRSTSTPEDLIQGAPARASNVGRRTLALSRRYLTTQEIRLSVGLRKSLGIHAEPEVTSPISAQLPAKRWSGRLLNAMSFANTVREAAARSMRRMSVKRKQEPSLTEISRGMRIAPLYDMYTAESGHLRVREMDAEVFHHRPVQSRPTEDDEEDEDDDELSSDGSWTMSWHDSEETCHKKSSSGVSKSNSKPKPRSTRSNYEILASWGVIVGGLLHATELDFKAVTDKAIHKRMYCPEKMRKGMVLESVRRRSRLILQQAWALCKEIAREGIDTLDSDWSAEGLMVRLFSTEYIDSLLLVANAAVKIFAAQPTVVEASIPCRVFGDLHGQLRDLLLFLWAYGSPDMPDAPSFVFNGDFVDRGAHQLETICLLLSLKVLMPEKVWLVRGNHEERKMNGRYGFEHECLSRLGPRFGPLVFDVMQKAFDLMPFACVVGGRALVVHGGIGKGTWRLNQLRAIKRPVTGDDLLRPGMEWVNDILWSDPIEDDADEQLIFGVHESPRSSKTRAVSTFAWNVTKTFCARNGLSLIIRSHQAKKNGRGFDIMHESLLVRVFSARDYERNGNDGAVLLLSKEDDGLVTVRPQVLRSLAKARQSAAVLLRSQDGVGQGTESGALTERPGKKTDLKMEH